MALELFRVMAGIDITMVHYKGAGAATIDLLAGQVHISNVTIPAAGPHIKTGRIRGPGTGGVQRSALLPDVPTVQVSWVTMGAKVAQLGLFFGADDFGSTMMEENVVASAGVAFRMSEEEIVATIRDAGFTPARRSAAGGGHSSR